MANLRSGSGPKGKGEKEFVEPQVGAEAASNDDGPGDSRDCPPRLL